MNQDRTAPDLEEAVLAQFVADLEQSANAKQLVADYTERHPEMAEQLNEMARVIRALDERRWEPDESPPSHLGEFRIVREVPGGGMGRVYEAIQETLGRRVAVKTIRGDCLSSSMRARFLREQMVLASLHQTHIVPIHTAGQSGDLQYFVMPYIEGLTLHQVIETVKREQTLSPSARTPTLAQLASRRVDSRVLSGTDGTKTLPTDYRVSAPASAPQKIRLSMDYFRSIAKVLLDAAEAFHHVHGLQILHRDLKPSNLMVDTAGECWIIDFGLAAYLHDGARPNAGAEGARSERGSACVHRRLTFEEAHGPGTPSYMAPEQWKNGTVDARTDVWGLGVTLYELLTLRQAFPGASRDEIRRKIESDDPPPSHRFVRDVPRDLEAVCLKALKKEPSARYQTARELAADLRRWLNHEPVKARRIRVPRRVWLWARRNRGWATALVVFCLACAAAAAAEIRSERHRAAFSEAEEVERQRESLLQRMQNVRLMPHRISEIGGYMNWVDEGWDLVRRAAQIHRDDALRDQAAAFLSGIGGHAVKIVPDFDASAVAFDAEGRHVLIGGSTKDEARIWDSKTDETQKTKLTGAGPVTFRSDGTALQLVATGADRFPLLLRDAAKGKVFRELRAPLESSGTAADESFVSAKTLTSEGKFAAASATVKSGAELCIVWDAASGRIVRQIRQSGGHITTVAVSPDGGFLAVGDVEGHVTVWPLPEGEPFGLPSASSAELHCLEFGSHVHGPASKDQADKWLLASGDAGGSVTIWDLGRKAALAFCHGSYYDVYALAFSPDGVTLASTGRSRTMLWDIATGRLLLQVYGVDNMTGVAFSRDGRKLAVSMGPNPFPHPPPKAAAIVWELEPHRGVQTLRGMTSQIAASKVCFSRDGTKIAAVSVDWRVGIWDLPSGVLRYRLDMPAGVTADNAGLAFSPDGRHFAVSAGSHARLWNLNTGTETTWQLPEGLLDALVFDSTGTRLFSCRMETSDWSHAPNSNSSYQQFPRVCRVRDLLAAPGHDLRRARKNNPTWQTDVFNKRLIMIGATPDGRYLVATGEHETAPNKPESLLKVFESATGKELLTLASEWGLLEATSNLLAFTPDSGPHPRPQTLIEIPSGKWVASIGPFAAVLGPGARLVALTDADGEGFLLHRRGEKTPLVKLGIDALWMGATFSPDGTRLAWGTQDGTVNVCYLPEAQRQMAAFGFGW
jgi:serine/threonine protein kinase